MLHALCSKYGYYIVIRIVVFDGSTAIQTLISFCIQTSIQNHFCECFCFPAEEFNQDLDNELEGWMTINGTGLDPSVDPL